MRLTFQTSISFPSFQLCRLKQPSLLPQTPSPATYRFSPVNPKAFDIAYPNVLEPPPSTPDHPFLSKRHLSNNVVSVDCGCRSRSSCFQNNNVSSEYGNKKTSTVPVPVPEKLEEESKLHHRMLYNSPVSDVSDASDTWPVRFPRAEKTKMKDRKKEKKKAKVRAFRSTSSVENDNWFSTDDNEETESLVSSSRSFESSYCYDFVFGNSLEAISEGPVTDARTKTTKKNQKVRTVLNHTEETGKAAASGYPAKTSVLRWLGPCTVEGKVKESFAVVKRSEDPYEDFKRSMLEMILEKQMSETKDLEQLLLCFLSLNSRHHHAAIVDAFTEIWEALFCDTP
ncbi:transcription repressor OFP7-like [Diospyros lotus]|uniref:transcription repressor OFP7-like n=1 Tax=Diospyros lotus TaxID=55363 RepID=UPI00224EE12A|nr:transcription repressor OFP7-like [Diospyros lotus]